MIWEQQARELIRLAIQEDIKEGDHTSMACMPDSDDGTAELIAKSDGVISGVQVAEWVAHEIDAELKWVWNTHDGAEAHKGAHLGSVSGPQASILTAERLMLNYMQRMSGIATKTSYITGLIAHTDAKLLDTRKTTPNFRIFEKMAVADGGGTNHRMGLYDMIMIKDNHIDFAGGITEALKRVEAYLQSNKLDLQIEVETRKLTDIEEALSTGIPNRIMFDNFSVDDTIEAVRVVNGKVETESSGGITESNIIQFAETGVDFISVGALTHQIESLDMSLVI